MRRSLGSLTIGIALLGAGCSSSYPAVRNRETPANVTYPIAFGSYQRVYNTTYHVVNRYGVIKHASYRSGEIEAEIGQDNQLFDKTRRTILARIFDAGEHYDVECRVLIAIEDSEVETFGEFQPRYQWRTIASDSLLETKLNNEIKSALTGGAFESKTPLRPEGKPGPAAHPKIRIAPSPGSEEEGQREDSAPKQERNASDQKLREARVTPHDADDSAEEAEKLGLKLMERGQYARAVTAFETASLRKGAGHAPYLLAHALFAVGDYHAAAEAIRAGAARDPEWPRARLDLRGFYGEIHDLRAHVASLERFQHMHPTDADAALVLGYVAYFTGDFAHAAAAFALLPKDDAVAETYRRFTSVELDRARGLEEF